MASYIDPFGAPEFLVDDVAYRNMVGTDFVRFGYYSLDQNEKILRMKLIFPLRRLIEAQDETRLFVTMQQRCLHQRLMHLAN